MATFVDCCFYQSVYTKNQHLSDFLSVFLTSVALQATEKTLSFPPWGIVVCISLVVMAIMPVPVVFGLRYFNIIDENTSSLSTVSYKKGRIIKESARLEEDDDASLIHGKPPSEAPSPMPGNSIYRKQSGSGGTDADTAPNGRYGIGYLMADVPDMPESDL